MYGKATGNSLVGPKKLVGRVSRNHLSGANRISCIEGDSDVVPAYTIGTSTMWGRYQERNSVLC